MISERVREIVEKKKGWDTPEWEFSEVIEIHAMLPRPWEPINKIKVYVEPYGASGSVIEGVDEIEIIGSFNGCRGEIREDVITREKKLVLFCETIDINKIKKEKAEEEAVSGLRAMFD